MQGLPSATLEQQKQRPSVLFVVDVMSDAQRFRDRARDCRNLAKSARDIEDAVMLEEIAEELDVEARKIEIEESKLPEE